LKNDSFKKIQALAREFDFITLGEMDQVQLMNRVDTKFAFSQDQLATILYLLKDYYRILSVEGVLLSEYESLYYDNNELTSYSDHHRKKPNRFKVRYRKYVSSNIVFLEIKHKKNGRTEKNRTSVPSIPNEMSDEQSSFLKKNGFKGENLKPSLLNSFGRITLVSNEKNERLTLDLNLTFEWGEKKKIIENVIIAELKQAEAMRSSPFYQLMKQNQIRPLNISKYCLGIVAIYGKRNVKYNRFKSKLLKIKKIQSYVA